MACSPRLTWMLLFVGLAALGGAGCGGSEATAPGSAREGMILIDGSSTVAPISEAVSEEFRAAHPGVRAPVGTSGTGGGFKKFCIGETDISDASRPIKPEEAELARKNGIAYIELPVAYDGLSVLVNPENTFVDHLSVEELKRIWEPNSSVRLWSDVRPAWPPREIKLYAPGADSGTFDYFTQAICGKEGASRQDCQFSEDDNQLVTGIAGDRDALGYFGYAYYVENQDKLRLVPIQAAPDAEPIAPSEATIRDGTYQPLSRPVFIYVSAKAAQRPEVQEFVRFYLSQAKSLVEEVGYVPLTDEVYRLARDRFEQRKTGSLFGESGAKVGVRLEDLLRTIEAAENQPS